MREGTEVIVGRNDLQARLGRFAHLLPQLSAGRPGQALLRADLRYTNGFSLTWQAIQAPIPVGVPAPRAPAAPNATKQQART